MERSFNITGACNPQEHYIINLDSRLSEIKKMVYNGKATTLKALKKYLQDDYTVISFDFQNDMSELDFKIDFGKNGVVWFICSKKLARFVLLLNKELFL